MDDLCSTFLPVYMTVACRKALKQLGYRVFQPRPVIGSNCIRLHAQPGGKQLTSRLIKHANARRILFLVDRSNLGRQTLKEFQAFRTPEENRLFTELYNVQHMQSSTLDGVSRVCITTIQRLYSMLKGEELDPALEEESTFVASALLKEPVPVSYNPKLPIEASTSSSPTSVTARSTTSGARCWSTSG